MEEPANEEPRQESEEENAAALPAAPTSRPSSSELTRPRPGSNADMQNTVEELKRAKLDAERAKLDAERYQREILAEIDDL